MKTDSPILKIGAVVLRQDGAVLILQPIPKHAGETPPYVLARGSRQYQDATGEWHDARDNATGAKHAATLEDFYRGFEREVEEEAGVTPAHLAKARIIEMGPMMFQSRSKGVYPIHWFVVVLADTDAEEITQTKPADALSTRWATLLDIKELASRSEFSAGYIPVIEAALARMK